MTAIRLAPSGPVIGNTDGGPLDFGPGARLRLTEANSIMGGSLALPTVPDVISPDGFGDVDAIVLTLLAPKSELKYRANLTLDVLNNTTNAGGEAVLYLDVSLDGGATYTNVVRNSHLVKPGILGSADPVAYSRPVSVWLPQVSGEALGVVTDTTPSIKLRARAQASSGNPFILANSPAASGGIVVTGLSGTIHMELEETF
jgi:hypothetical protein